MIYYVWELKTSNYFRESSLVNADRPSQQMTLHFVVLSSLACQPSKLSVYVPTKEHLRTLLLYFFNINKNASEAHRLLVEAYGDDVPSIKTYATWFQRFKSGDFDVSDKHRPGQPKKIEDAELQALLDEDSCQTQ